MDLIKLFHLPIEASSSGYKVDMIIYLIHALMFVLFVGWAIYFIIVLYKFREGKNPRANYHGAQSHITSWVEIGVIIFEAVLLLGFSIPFWNKQVNAYPKRSDAIEIRIVAEQFAWNIHYPGADGIFGRSDPKFFDKQSNPLGIDPNDPHGKDDITTINQLHLPVGKPVIIHLTTKDVMHSFFLPVMRVKQDIIPGMSIPTWFTPTKTGKFEIACAQLCGLGHYRMKGYLTVETQKDYDQWLKDNAPSAEDQAGYDDFWN